MTGNSNFVSDPIIAALLSEVSAKLAEIVESGTTFRIDLRRLPLPAGGTAALRDFLGSGQVEASFRGVGSCIVSETAVAGVWWGQQYNTGGDLVGEFIEIAYVPELLKCETAEIEQAVKNLRLKIRDAQQIRGSGSESSSSTNRSPPSSVSRIT